MPSEDITNLLGLWEGYRVARVQRFEACGNDGVAEVWIELERLPGGFMCPGCGRRCKHYHDVSERWVRDLPILDATTWLLVPRFRTACAKCGPKVEDLPWLAKWSRVTTRLAESVARLCQVLPIKQVAAFFSLKWDAVKSIDKAYLKETLGSVDVSGVEVIGMDEFALHKGQRYATVIVDPRRKRVLWVGKGHGREDIRPFFELLGEEGRQDLRAVVMDMNGAYEKEVRVQCPSVEIIYDLFHVVAKYGREVIDRVRGREAKRLRHDEKQRKVIKGSRWLLLRNRKNLRRHEDQVKLKELLQANRKLMTVYVLKDDLKHLWDYRRSHAAERFWKQWYNRAIRSRIEPLKLFARRLKPYVPGILAHCRWPFHTSLLEGINNKIKVIKRMAYGFRDEEYFFLKIRAAFPGNPG